MPPENARPTLLPKDHTGIQGLDEITKGGLPSHRSTMVLGNAGCGKTLLSMEFLVRGAAELGIPGLFVAFEETSDELVQNMRSLGWDLEQLMAQGLIALDFIQLDPQEIIESGDYDLEGLFVRLATGIREIGAKRVVLDTIETLYAGLANSAVLRSELRRLIRWLREQGVTSIFTGELGPDGQTRHGIEDYAADCVIRLDHRVVDQISTRRLWVAKYRGSPHGTNEYPFIIGAHGFEILPITSLRLDAAVSDERISTGIPRLDAMFDAGGPYRGSSILIAGTAGTGKTSIAAHFLQAACARGERALYLSFEESPAQTLRNMRSIGLDLTQWRDRGLLTLSASRPTALGLDAHLAHILELIRTADPALVVVDPITHLSATQQSLHQKSILIHLLDRLKSGGVTAVLTDLTRAGDPLEGTSTLISSLIDTWIVLRGTPGQDERGRVLYIVKSRGMAHSNEVHEYRISGAGIELADDDGALASASAGSDLESRRHASRERAQRRLERQRGIAAARIAIIEAELAEQEAALDRAGTDEPAAATAVPCP